MWWKSKECPLTIDEKYQGKDSSTLYDEMYDLIMSHLDSLVVRKSGKVVYYNEQNQFGNISVYDHDQFSLDKQILLMMKKLKETNVSTIQSYLLMILKNNVLQKKLS